LLEEFKKSRFVVSRKIDKQPYILKKQVQFWGVNTYKTL